MIDARAALTWLARQGAAEMFYAAVIFVVVALLTRCFRRASPRLLYALWGLVLLRLMLPPNLAAPWSLAALGARISAPWWTLANGTAGATAAEPGAHAHPPWRPPPMPPARRWRCSPAPGS